MRAGAATTSITPALDTRTPVWLAGFGHGRQAKSVHDELTVRALVLECDQRRVALVSIDLIGLMRDEIERVRSAPRVAKLAFEHLVIACTHTHSGPDTVGLWGQHAFRSGIDPAYLDLVHAATVQALEEATSALCDAQVRFAETTTPGLIRDTLPPYIIDDRLLVMQVDDLEGRGIASLINWSNHAEVLWEENLAISADYPGALRECFEEEVGGVALFFPGSIGGLMTPDKVVVQDPDTGARPPERSFAKARALGRCVARIGLQALSGALASTELDLDVKRAEFAVALGNPHFRAGLTQGLLSRESVVERDGILYVLTETSILRLGPAAFLAIPGEIYPELILGGVVGSQAEDGTPGWAYRPVHDSIASRHLFVLGLANDELGYIIPPSQWDISPTEVGDDFDPTEVNSVGIDLAPALFAALETLVPGLSDQDQVAALG